MKRFFKIFLCFSFLAILCEPLYANQEEVRLNVNEIRTLKAPVHSYQTKYESAYDTDSSYFEAEDDIFESKAGKTFSKIVDKVIINNKVNKYASKIGN